MAFYAPRCTQHIIYSIITNQICIAQSKCHTMGYEGKNYEPKYFVTILCIAKYLHICSYRGKYWLSDKQQSYENLSHY